jgi:hypothetical protein
MHEPELRLMVSTSATTAKGKSPSPDLIAQDMSGVGRLRDRPPAGIVTVEQFCASIGHVR